MSLKCPQCGSQLDLKWDLKLTSNGVASDNFERVLDSKPSPKRSRYQYTNPLFLAFWEAYPRRIGKAAASQKFAQITSQIAPQIIINAALNFASVCRANHTEQRFIPYPKTWLNDGRWEDENWVPLAVGEIEVFDKEAHLRELEAI